MPAIYKNSISYTGDSNAASVSVKVSDTTMNMQQLATNLLGDMASVESPTAKAVHAVGEYIVVDGVMYKVTAAIAVGNTITPGTNVTKTTAGAELAALNSRTPGSCVFSVLNQNGTYNLPSSRGILFVTFGSGGGSTGAFMLQQTGYSDLVTVTGLTITTSGGVHTIKNTNSLGMRFMFIGI